MRPAVTAPPSPAAGLPIERVALVQALRGVLAAKVRTRGSDMAADEVAIVLDEARAPVAAGEVVPVCLLEGLA